MTNSTVIGDLYVTLMNAMGIETTTFGDSRYCSGGLGGMT
jgi:hypothetical protein